MIKKIVISIFILIGILLVSILTYIIYINYIKKTPNNLNNQLLFYINSNEQKKPTMLVIFSPECGPCQILSKNIYSNRDSLKKINLLLASTKDSIITNSFFNEISTTWVNDMHKIKYIYDSRKKIGSYFVEMGLPKVYVFDKSGQIKYKSDGPIHIDSIKTILKRYE